MFFLIFYLQHLVSKASKEMVSLERVLDVRRAPIRTRSGRRHVNPAAECDT